MSKPFIRRGFSLALLTIAVIILISFALAGCFGEPMIRGTITNGANGAITVANEPFLIGFYSDPGDASPAYGYSQTWPADNNITCDYSYGLHDVTDNFRYYIKVKFTNHPDWYGWYGGSASPTLVNLRFGARCDITVEDNTPGG